MPRKPTPPAEDQHALRHTAARIEEILRERYGEYRREGPEPVLDSMVEAILSQNTNDLNRDRAFRSLRRKFPTWTKVMSAPRGEVAEAIKVGGLSNQKSGWIQDLLRWVKETRGHMDLDDLCGMTPRQVLEKMGHLKGIGVKTVYVTLLFACGQDVFPVDTHIHRVVRRVGLIPWKASRNRTTELMQPLAPEGKRLTFHVNLIRFGRDICLARKPRCPFCPLGDICLYPQKTPLDAL